jgi:hypothetical protein
MGISHLCLIVFVYSKYHKYFYFSARISLLIYICLECINVRLLLAYIREEYSLSSMLFYFTIFS